MGQDVKFRAVSRHCMDQEANYTKKFSVEYKKVDHLSFPLYSDKHTLVVGLTHQNWKVKNQHPKQKDQA